MNRYPLWKYILIGITILVALVYALPNLYGDAPAVQVTAGKATVTVDAALLGRMEDALKQANIPYTAAMLAANSASVRFSDTDIQLRAKHVIEQALDPDPSDPAYVVALNLVSASPGWLTDIHAYPMYLGLDLRGGVHFLLQVDMQYALKKRAESIAGEIRTRLRDKDVRYTGLTSQGGLLKISFRDAAMRAKARDAIVSLTSDLALADRDEGSDYVLVGTLKREAIKRTEDYALKQNIQTLHNRINELGVAEPVIQQEGADRIVVELPGIQDTARAKEILGRTASLEVHMVDENQMNAETLAAAAKGQVPFGDEYYVDRNGQPLLIKKQVVLTGDRITDAEPGFDSQTGEPAVHLTLDSVGARIFRDVTRENVGKRMAILLIDRGKGEVITAPVIRSEIGGGRVQISGHMNTMEANNIALLLRAGALAAPMNIVEERTVGPSLGRENIQKGFDATRWGFSAIVVFMSVYYLLFGVVSAIALAVNLLFLVALLSLLQATLTMPGIAAIALALGMAIDSNVLINERIREEIRGGATPQAAIAAGYTRAWGTILDSNVTTLIAGLSLLIFGTGPVRGFAVVHVLGILTSIFSAVVVSRGIVNLIYGHRRRVAKLSIGNTAWK
ncbi:MAG: protein translocase subunit SecD [Betaproteobacteria bacterium]|nr:protein translocase subunit SecD [Betaproteobacteria bacterium]